MTREPHLSERIAMRARPRGWPLMYQSWDDVLFIHWEIDPNVLRPLIPKPLEIDTFDGKAYLAVTPLTLWNVRPALVPPLPWVSDFHELNVRTYVYYDGVPGVWFFSLDANRSIPVWGARTFFYLPYFEAQIRFEKSGGRMSFSHSRITDEHAIFEAVWTSEGGIFHTEPGTLDFFLIERYCLYTSHENDLYRCRIHHEEWPLREAKLHNWSGDILEANGIPTPVGGPLVHLGGPVKVEVWPLNRVTESILTNQLTPELALE